MAIYFYEDHYYSLSNWSAHQILFQNILYPTSEHAYHSQKFSDEAIRNEILHATSPLRAKEIAYIYKNKQIPEWNDKKITTMTEILKAKTTQHIEVMVALQQSGTEEIIENSPDDYFWGIGIEKTGRNELGKIWMIIRKEISIQNMA